MMSSQLQRTCLSLWAAHHLVVKIFASALVHVGAPKFGCTYITRGSLKKRGLAFKAARKEPYLRSVIYRFLHLFLRGGVTFLLNRGLTRSFDLRERLYEQLLRYRVNPVQLLKRVLPQLRRKRTWLTLFILGTMRVHDPSLLLTFLVRHLHEAELYHHRYFLQVFATVCRYILQERGKGLGIQGMSWRICGKLGVTGNARTRTMHVRVGVSSAATRRLRLDQQFSIVKTSTGCLGFWCRYYF